MLEAVLPDSAEITGVYAHIVENTAEVNDCTETGGVWKIIVPREVYGTVNTDTLRIEVRVRLKDGFTVSCFKELSLGCYGGRADCTEKAKCEVCGNEYGEIEPNCHGDLKYVAAKAPTEAEEGNTAYWYCTKCKKRFEDENAEKELTVAETVLPRLTPNGDETKADSITEIPATGDRELSMILLILSAAFAVMCLCKKPHAANSDKR